MGRVDPALSSATWSAACRMCSRHSRPPRVWRAPSAADPGQDALGEAGHECAPGACSRHCRWRTPRSWDGSPVVVVLRWRDLSSPQTEGMWAELPDAPGAETQHHRPWQRGARSPAAGDWRPGQPSLPPGAQRASGHSPSGAGGRCRVCGSSEVLHNRPSPPLRPRLVLQGSGRDGRLATTSGHARLAL